MQTNFIDDLYPLISFELTNAYTVLEQYNISARDIVNLCGGIPSPHITNIHVVLSSQYASALCIEINTDQYELVRRLDFDIRKIDNTYMYVHNKGQGIGTNLFLTQVQTARNYHFEKLHTTAMAPIEDEKWNGYYFWAHLGFENTETTEYRAWAAKMGRQESTLSELVQTQEGRDLWNKNGYPWIGDFYLATGHPCAIYLQNHLERKGIDYKVDE